MSSSSRNRQRFTLRANERLKLRKQIETLFLKGEAFSFFPIKIIYRLCELPAGIAEPNVLVGFSVPKRKIKNAVNRNRVRRILREAWRLNKHHLYKIIPPGQQLHCFLIYTDDKPIRLKTAQYAVAKLTERFQLILNSAPD